jgi:hypothetical protein
MSSGGGGGGGKTEFEWNDQLKPYWSNLLSNAAETADQPYTNYFQSTGQSRVAGLNPDQNEGMDYTRNMARMSSSPIPAMDGARSGITDTLRGMYLNANPYANGQNNPWASTNPSVGHNDVGNEVNPWRNVTVGPSANPAAGAANAYQGMDNPYFHQMVQSGMDDITGAYQRGTAADTNKMFALSGAYGGSAHQQAVQNNQTTLGKNLSQYVSGLQNSQYDRSGQMDEARLGRAFEGGESLAGRDLQAQTFNKQIGSQLDEAGINRRYGAQDTFNAQNLQNQQFNKQLGLQSWEQGQDRGSQNFLAERGNMMGAIPLGQNEQGLAYQRIGGMMGIGDFQRGVGQQQIDENYNNWFDANNYNKNQNAWLAGILSGAQGGLPPNQMTSAPGNAATNSLGAALAAYGLFRNS